MLHQCTRVGARPGCSGPTCSALPWNRTDINFRQYWFQPKMTTAQILLEKVHVKKMAFSMCPWCLWLLLHSNKENEKSVFLGQCGWLQTPTPVLPMIRKSIMWNLPNPMVSTASSTVNVFCPEHQRERNTETKNYVSSQIVPPFNEMWTLFMLLWDCTRKKAGNIYQLCVHWPVPGHSGGRAR